MAKPVFIGDEATAAGFRLAGFSSEAPSAEETGEALRRARREAGLVVASAHTADVLSGDELDDALRDIDTLLAVVPDINATHMPEDMEARVRELLGIES